MLCLPVSIVVVVHSAGELRAGTALALSGETVEAAVIGLRVEAREGFAFLGPRHLVRLRIAGGSVEREVPAERFEGLSTGATLPVTALPGRPAPLAVDAVPFQTLLDGLKSLAIAALLFGIGLWCGVETWRLNRRG
ncbi:MAG: hypothetical protein AAGG47_14125 [Pseudomonadota bacterium]